MSKEIKKAVLAVFVIGVISVYASGCGKSVSQGDTGATGAQGPQGEVGPPGPVASITPVPETTVQQMVDTENAYRVSVGQEQLLSGLNCALYTVPTTTTQIVGATLTGVGNFLFTGVFNQTNASVTTGLNILPAALESVYQTWYIVKCTGNLVVSDDNYHEFDINSDDGANLYVDGLLINNDGLHAQVDKSATKYLKYGFHSFELDYFQAQGAEALTLNEDGSVMQPTGFYH